MTIALLFFSSMRKYKIFLLSAIFLLFLFFARLAECQTPTNSKSKNNYGYDDSTINNTSFSLVHNITREALKHRIESSLMDMNIVLIEYIKDLPEEEKSFVRSRWRGIVQGVSEILKLRRTPSEMSALKNISANADSDQSTEKDNATTIETKGKICTGSQHVRGRWVKIDQTVDSKHSFSQNLSLQKSFHCCADNPSKDPFPNRTWPVCGNKSQLMENYVIGSDEHNTQTGGAGCTCDRVYGQDDPSPRELYRWKPDSCQLIDWNAKLFCGLLGARRVLLIGDSTMQQTAATLFSMVTAGKGGCSTQLSFGRLDNLYFPRRGPFVEKSLEEYLQLSRPDLVVLTSGAHLGDLGDFDAVLYKMKGILANYRSGINPAAKFLWKTQNPGQHNCDRFTFPAEIFQPAPDSEDRYRWNLHVQFDEMSRNRSEAFGYKIVDMSPLYLRGDAHPASSEPLNEQTKVDCLHYCIPGPLDLFSVLLLNMLYTKEV